MVGTFLGRSGQGDSLVGLLRLIKDPDTIESHLKQIKIAETAHQESLKKGREVIAADQAKLAAAKAAHLADAKGLQERETALTAAVKKHEAEVADFETQKKSFVEFEKKTSTELSRQEEKIKVAQEALMKRQRDLDMIEKRLSNLEQKAKELITREKALDIRDKELSKLEEELAAKAAKVRELLS